MPFRLLRELFPDLAERETRSITIPAGSNVGLPADEYGFPEMFCDEVGCDCRRVFFYVVSRFRRRLEAVVAWGWEDLDFYARWFKYGDRKDAPYLKGPILNPGSPATELAPAVLELVRNVLLKDPAYVERIERHYKMFRERIDGQARRQPGKQRKKRRR